MQLVLVAGLTMFSAVGFVALACSVRFSWRQHTAVIVPIALGFAALAVSGWLWFTEHDAGRAARWLTWGFFGEVAYSSGWFWLALPTLVVLAVPAWFSFRAEGWLASRRSKLSAGIALPPELMAVSMPARAESLQVVAETAAHPVRYWAISGWTVLGEEVFFRVAAPATLMLAGLPPIIAIVVPAALYGANHIGFGLVSVLGKFLLGIVLGTAAWICGAWVAALIHLLYQHWVRRQFDPRSRGGRHVIAAAAP